MKQFLLLVLILPSVFLKAFADDTSQPNILFIMVDDLRVELGAYGGPYVKSPNIDKLAQSGTRFENAYVSVPVCGASRASLFTGMRALPERFVRYHTWVQEDAPNALTIFEQFKNNGYNTIGYGKIFHQTQDTAKKSWTSGRAWIADYDQDPKKNTSFRNYQRPENIALHRETGTGPSTESFDGPDEVYFDGMVANKTIKTLNKLAKKDEPFFLAVGFVKPHLPFNAPKKYWDLYNPKQLVIPPSELPVGAPKNAYHKFGELRSYSDTPKAGPVSEEQALRLIHGYHASVSYTDAQVGKVLDHLESIGLSENTIVVLMGDHGYSLGEHGLWCKHSTFDVATKTPLIIRAPNMPGNNTVDGLVEFIDIFPTLTDLANIDSPDQLAGMSLKPLLKDGSLPARSAVFPRYHSAEAIRTDQFTLTQWYNKKGDFFAEMLYDNINDPDETRNLARLKDYSDIRRNLEIQLVKHMRTRK